MLFYSTYNREPEKTCRPNPSSVCRAMTSVLVRRRNILRDVSGEALPGRLLAIMGPSGWQVIPVVRTMKGRLVFLVDFWEEEEGGGARREETRKRLPKDKRTQTTPLCLLRYLLLPRFRFHLAPFRSAYIQFRSVSFDSGRFCWVLCGSVRSWSVPFGSVRFDSVPFISVWVRSASSCFAPFYSVQFRSTAFSFGIRSVQLDSVRFRLIPFVSFGSVRFCSVLFGSGRLRFGSIQFRSVPFRARFFPFRFVPVLFR